MYTIAFVDRTNISLALPAMRADLHMDPEQAGSAAGIFFWGYMLLQIPGGYLAEHWSAKRFVAILLVVWGACSAATGLVRTGQEFWAMRLLLGVAEGGVWPATLVLLAHWFPRAERARANAYWMLCLPVAVVVSSPISGWMLGRFGWRMMLITEGLLPLAWLVIWLSMIADHPRQARWISTQERGALETILAKESQELETAERPGYLSTLARPGVLAMVMVYFLQNAGNYGYLFWLPSAIQSVQKVSGTRTGWLFSIPYVLTGMGMVAMSRHSDRQRERRGHVAAGYAWGGLFLLAGVLLSRSSVVLSGAAIALVGAGSYGVLGPFWAIPTETLPKGASGSAMGLINAIGNLGGYFGPLMVGFLNKRTGNFVYGFGFLGAGLVLAAILSALFLPAAAERKI